MPFSSESCNQKEVKTVLLRNKKKSKFNPLHFILGTSQIDLSLESAIISPHDAVSGL
jgi:hypothetical protein